MTREQLQQVLNSLGPRVQNVGLKLGNCLMQFFGRVILEGLEEGDEAAEESAEFCAWLMNSAEELTGYVEAQDYQSAQEVLMRVVAEMQQAQAEEEQQQPGEGSGG